MEIIIVSVAIVMVLVLVLAVMKRRPRRTGHTTRLDESGIRDARSDRSSRASGEQ